MTSEKVKAIGPPHSAEAVESRSESNAIKGQKLCFTAIHQAAVHRFRPVLLTTLTTFGGLTPMIFETSRQARFLIPMAISLGYGILFATVITLVLVPSFYLVQVDITRLIRWTGLFQRRETPPPDAAHDHPA